jgi:hypothetical protein
MQGSRSSVLADTRRQPRANAWTAALFLSTLAGGTALAGSAAVDRPDCEERLERAVEAISTHARVRDVPRGKLKATTEFVLGNTLFALLHEMAHGLISDLGLPVLGHEEDAADAFATVTMLEMKSEFTHRILVNAVRSWMISDRRSRENGEPAIYYDAHGLDLQRAYSVICLMVGSDPEQFDDLANEANMPEDRRVSCQGDYSNASWSWANALKPYLLSPGQEPVQYSVEYGTAEGSLDIFERALRASGIMEHVAWFAGRYAWRHGFNVQATTCGESGATWSIPDRKAILCYELADEFVQLYQAHGEDPLAALSPPLSPTARPARPMGFR